MSSRLRLSLLSVDVLKRFLSVDGVERLVLTVAKSSLRIIEIPIDRFRGHYRDTY